MKNYIILRGGIQEHYFIDYGIYSHSQKNGFYTVPHLINSHAVRDFGLFADDNENVHIISTDSKNNIIYTLINKTKITHHTILSARQGIIVSDFSIMSQNGILNLFYTASSDNELFLVHCVLGNNAMPTVISRLCDRSYFIHESRIYFSNEHTTLGYCDFSDCKPTEFVSLFENSTSPYIDGHGKNKHIIYKHGSELMLDGVSVFTDAKAENPVFVSGSTPLLMWSSSGTVNYIPVTDKSKEAASPMRFISAGRPPELFCMQRGNELRYFYGTYSDTKVNIFGKSDLFSQPINPPDNELQKLKVMLTAMQKEISEIKEQFHKMKSNQP